MQTWPELPLASWADSKETLHRWTQVVGKIRLALTPKVNHWWNTVLYVTARGLTTSMMPAGDRWFEIEFDFIAHVLHIRVSDGGEHDIPLGPRSVAEVHRDVFAALRSLGVECHIWTMPVEIDDPIPLDSDEQHHAYDPEAVRRFWEVLARVTMILEQFRARFIGKCSPVHFFWGSFDLAVTRFSGRRAHAKAGADPITAEAYSHEVSSVGWWPGDARLPKPAFYSYAAPEPDGFRTAVIEPQAAYYDEKLGGFYYLYDDFRTAADPAASLLAFCQSTYDAAANAGKWDRAELERR